MDSSIFLINSMNPTTTIAAPTAPLSCPSTASQMQCAVPDPPRTLASAKLSAQPTRDSTLISVDRTPSYESRQLSEDDDPVTSNVVVIINLQLTVVPAAPSSATLSDGSLEQKVEQVITVCQGGSTNDIREAFDESIKKSAQQYGGIVKTVTFATNAQRTCWASLVHPRNITVDVLPIPTPTTRPGKGGSVKSPSLRQIGTVAGIAGLVVGAAAAL